MYSLERSEKSTGAATHVLALPWRSFTRVRVMSSSMRCTSRSGSSSRAKQARSNTASARVSPSAACGSPGANSSPP